MSEAAEPAQVDAPKPKPPAGDETHKNAGREKGGGKKSFYVAAAAIAKTVVAGAIGAVIVALAFSLVTTQRRSLEMRHMLYELEESKAQIRELIEMTGRAAEDKRIPAATVNLERKKRDFLGIAGVTFIYVDPDEIKNQYSMNFREATVETLVEKLVSSQEGEVATGEAIAAFVSSGLKGNNLSEYIRTVRFPESTLPEMYLRFQRLILDQERVKYGFDDINLRLEEIDTFKGSLTKVFREHDLALEGASMERWTETLRRRIVDDALAELEKIDQYVLLSGKYSVNVETGSIDPESDSSSEVEAFGYRLEYIHPLNAHLKHIRGAKIMIMCTLRKGFIQPSYVSVVQKVAKKRERIPLKIFGKVLRPLDREAESWEIEIVPFAVF